MSESQKDDISSLGLLGRIKEMKIASLHG